MQELYFLSKEEIISFKNRLELIDSLGDCKCIKRFKNALDYSYEDVIRYLKKDELSKVKEIYEIFEVTKLKYPKSIPFGDYITKTDFFHPDNKIESIYDLFEYMRQVC